MRKKLLLIIAFIMLFAKPVSAGSVVFSDISRNWCRDYIEKMAESGLIKGYKDNTFRPDNEILNVEVYAIINRLMNYKSENEIAGLDNGKWYYEDLKKANDNGYAYIGRDFEVKPIKRIEMINIISDIFNFKGDPDILNFKDTENLTEREKTALAGLVNRGIIKGYGDNSVRPDGKLTRAEFVKIVVLSEKVSGNKNDSVIKVVNEDNVINVKNEDFTDNTEKIKETLEAKIRAARKYNLSDYAEESAEKLRRAINEAEDREGIYRDRDEILRLIDSIDNAVNNLKEKKKDEERNPVVYFKVLDEDDNEIEAEIEVNGRRFKNNSSLKPGNYYVTINADGMKEYRTYLIVGSEDKKVEVNMEKEDSSMLRLTLSEGLYCEQGDKFKPGERVIVKFNIPDNKSIDEFTVNGEKKELLNNEEYIFFISRDTDIAVKYK